MDINKRNRRAMTLTEVGAHPMPSTQVEVPNLPVIPDEYRVELSPTVTALELVEDVLTPAFDSLVAAVERMQQETGKRRDMLTGNIAEYLTAANSLHRTVGEIHGRGMKPALLGRIDDEALAELKRKNARLMSLAVSQMRYLWSNTWGNPDSALFYTGDDGLEHIEAWGRSYKTIAKAVNTLARSRGAIEAWEGIRPDDEHERIREAFSRAD